MVDLKIPAGTQPGTTLVMQKRGVPKLANKSIRGDHQVSLSSPQQSCSTAGFEVVVNNQLQTS